MSDDDEVGPRQGYLFPPFSRHGTSREAAASVAGSRANVCRRRVLEFIQSQGVRGATDAEIAASLEMDPSTVRPRRWELAGLDTRSPVAPVIELNGERRATPSGKAANVWVVVEFL